MTTIQDLTWQESYAIGIEEIDRQHMEFVKLLRRFNFGIQKGSPSAVPLRILDELMKYADYHFSTEENIMFFTKYPGISMQQREHDILRTGLIRRIDAYRRMPETGEQLSEFLQNWFTHHIQKEDRKIAAHLLGKKTETPGGSR